ncbi:FMRFamide receptor-like [Haliotis cracherodii]|uniref:FMRFamide receptor-like n=1 Tax=Haliotis cracherodii TaxID=6455 RepID=UPI0039E946D1
MSVWIVVAVTIERYVVVYYPLRAQRLCKVSRTRKIIGGLLCLSLAFSSQFVWTVGLRERVSGPYTFLVCGAIAGSNVLIAEVWPWLDALIYCLVPFSIISIFNVLIICRVGRSTTEQRELNDSWELQKMLSGDKGTRLTIMLLTVSFTFLITKLPVNISLIASPILNNMELHKQTMVKVKLAATVSELLMYFNHSINFFLYCASGQRFRKDFLIRFCRRRKQSFSVREQISLTKLYPRMQHGGVGTSELM